MAAVGDLHCRADTRRNIAVALRGVDQEAEVLLLAGDLTDHGTPDEALWLAEELSQVKMERCAVLGNHDYESGQDAVVRKTLTDAGVHVLDGDPWEVNSLGVAGVKGFAGGFDAAQLQRFGEDALKSFVDACIAEELKLEKALFRLRTKHRVALLHYSPCRPTLEGEPLEIFPFLGATRLAGPLDQLRPNLAVHGHAHRGTLRGATGGGVPVFNVALPVLRRLEKPLGYLTIDL
ncbi:MAG: metallophosphoesterase family protein [Myxococcales bacterium]|nr:metallophosphoesterase family protein [Myxococcales bacterium]